MRAVRIDYYSLGKFGNVECFVVRMLMSVGELQKRDGCVSVALVAIIKAWTAEDLRNVELMAVILVITVHCTILNK
jgi:hypothetical protein